MMVRTMADEPQDDDVTAQGLLKASLEVGATWISTNFPVPAPDRAYSVSIPGGAPLRCNPVTAPPSCTAKDIEDLAP